MKKNAILLILLVLVGCEQFITFDYYFPAEFDSVYCFIPERSNPYLKDTTIWFSVDDLYLLTLYTWDNEKKCGKISLGQGTIDSLYEKWESDTVSFFIFEQKVIENHTWDEIVQKYLVLQRYDFSKEDIIKLRYQIPYPPTKDMATMHMFPPFKE